ncbi:MAG TPA: SusC/RagA family TonB-linked outer membrane protein [Gemmatimonadaceae bacterium]|nr:SusC/RagA family TonB-linked outer membrane protein [Gemmatimonadaceae bacterium]
MHSGVRRLAAALFALAVLPAWAAAQGTITGKVTDRSNQQPVPNAQVLIVGTTRGTLTDDQGQFRITGVPAGTVQLRALRVGYASAEQNVTVASGQTATADFALAPSALTLDVVTVNAITGQQERRREAGTNTSLINTDSLNLAPIHTFADVLTARTTGINLQGMAGSVGTAQRIRIRGANSLSLSNEPLFYVDGVQISNAINANSGVGGQEVTRLNDIAPEDIENVEVIKGPAATAIYGSAGANGVILITTKRGKTGKARYNAFVEYGNSEDRNQYPSNFFAFQENDGGAPLLNPSGSLNTTARPRCVNGGRNVSVARGGCTQNGVLEFETIRDLRTSPFSVGERAKYGLSVAGGGDQVTYFLSGDLTRESGVIDYNTNDQINVRANVAAQVNDKLNLTATMGYTNADQVLNSNDNNVFSPIINGILGGPVFFGLDADGNPCTEGPTCLTPQLRNFGFSETNENDRALVEKFNVNHLTLGGTGNYQPLSWLTLNGNVGVDLTDVHDQQTVQPFATNLGGTFFGGNGFRDSDRSNNFLYTGNASATARFNLTPEIVSTTTGGASYQRARFESTFCEGTTLVPGANTRSCSLTSAQFSVAEGFSDNITVGGFVREQVGWKDRLFVAGSLRGDDNSAFGADIGVQYYPSANISWVLGDEPWFPKPGFMNDLRLRAAWGQAGLRPNFRQALDFFNSNPVVLPSGEEAPGITIGGSGNPNLKAERTTEYELGMDMGLFNGRAGVDFTFYHKRSEDALINVPLPPSLGVAGSQLQNLGSIRNQGIELGVNATPIDIRNFTASFRVSATTLANEIETLGADIPPIVINRGEQQHRVSNPAGAFWQRPFTFEDTNGDGKIDVNEITLGDTVVFLGNALPGHTISLSADFTLFKYVSVSTLFDERGNFLQENGTEQFRCQTGFARADRGCPATDDPNASLFDQARFLASLLGTQAGYIEDADFWKWRELSVTFRLPPSWTRGISALQGASLTVAGRNLKTWTDYDGLDPEINEQGASSNFNQNEFNTQPQVRTLTARLNLTF